MPKRKVGTHPSANNSFVNMLINHQNFINSDFNNYNK